MARRTVVRMLPDPMPLLNLTNVTKRFNGVTAVDSASFTVDRGEVVGFLGPNGAGKSTTMRLITQFYEPDEGEIRFDDVPLAEVGRDAKRRIGYLPESNPLYDEMAVAEYLDFVARLRGLAGPAGRAGLEEAIARTGIAEVYYRTIGELSKGYRQRVGLAQAILHRPDLLVLDEPTEGLDPNQRVEIRRLISELGRERTVMLSTHVLPEVQHTCTRILVIHQGRLAADGPVEQLTAEAEGAVQVMVEAVGEGLVEGVRALSGVLSVEGPHPRGGDQVAVTLVTDGSRDVRPDVFALARERGWTLYELHQETRSLENLFRQLTGGSGE